MLIYERDTGGGGNGCGRNVRSVFLLTRDGGGGG